MDRKVTILDILLMSIFTFFFMGFFFFSPFLNYYKNNSVIVKNTYLYVYPEKGSSARYYLHESEYLDCYKSPVKEYYYCKWYFNSYLEPIEGFVLSENLKVFR